MAILTMTRQAGSLGEDIGKAVAEKMGYVYVGKNILLREIKEYGNKWANWGKEFDEHCPSLWEHFDPSFAGFVAITEYIILKYAQQDNVVIMGRGGYWLLKDIPHALRVLIKAPEEFRIKNISEREHVNYETAKRLIEYSDHERQCYIKTVYKRDWLNENDYEMVFDTSELSIEEIVQKIISELTLKQAQKTKEAEERLLKLTLMSKVKAAISTDLRIFVPTLEVISDGDEIVIKGVVHSVKEHKIVEEIAKEATGDTVKIRCELSYRV